MAFYRTYAEQMRVSLSEFTTTVKWGPTKVALWRWANISITLRKKKEEAASHGIAKEISNGSAIVDLVSRIYWDLLQLWEGAIGPGGLRTPRLLSYESWTQPIRPVGHPIGWVATAMSQFSVLWSVRPLFAKGYFKGPGLEGHSQTHLPSAAFHGCVSSVVLTEFEVIFWS